jgi:hypothetical protein
VFFERPRVLSQTLLFQPLRDPDLVRCGRAVITPPEFDLNLIYSYQFRAVCDVKCVTPGDVSGTPRAAAEDGRRVQQKASA